MGPALELLRRVCQPTSWSLPHVTVRYPVKALEANDLTLYTVTDIEQLYIAGPGSFGLDPSVSEARSRNSVVFLRCESNLLESLAYKPDFPYSVFHLTVYEGPSKQFATRVLSVLREFRWCFDLTMPPTKVTKIPIGPTAHRSDSGHVRLSDAGTNLLRRWMGADADSKLLLHLAEDERIALVRSICEHIQPIDHDGRALGTGSPVESLLDRKSLLDSAGVQSTLWEESDVQASQSGGPAWATRRKQSRPSSRRAGLFLTPPELAQDMVSSALKSLAEGQRIDFGDPAFGTGIFFATLLRLAAGRRIPSAIGIEMDPLRAEQTSSKWRESTLVVRQGNLLDSRLEPTRSLVVANPPYVRFQLLNRSQSLKWHDRIERSLGLSVDGRADLYVYFILTTHEWLAPDAVSAWLLPSEFLQVNYGRVLREYLTQKVELLHLHTYDVATSQFENARVSSTVVVFRNRSPGIANVARLSIGGSLQDPLEVRDIKMSDLASLPKWVPASWGLRSSRQPKGTPIGKLFVVKRGIATGANNSFVLTTSEVSELGIPKPWVKPVIPKSRTLLTNIVNADSEGNPVVTPRLWLIDTDAPMDVVRREAPKLARYLEQVQAEVGTRNLLRARRPFYKQEVRPPPRYFVGYMGRADPPRLRSRFFLNRSVGVVLNNYFGLYPRDHVQALLDSGDLRDTDLLDALSSIDEREIAREGRVYVSGLHKIEPRELERIVVPGLPQAVTEATRRVAGQTL